MEKDLAIVIPAFKHQFFGKSLQSIANQTSKRFNLYIGDDSSPYDLNRIVKQYFADIHIVYFRFDNNLGNISLTRQWERCIQLSNDEKYIWLFSDDDIMPSDAVERFYRQIELNTGVDVYRFNLQFIDSEDRFIGNVTNHPFFESWVDFIERRFSFSTLSAACEYIFSREMYLKVGGFVDFPLAWCSDDATWISMAKKNGIVTIPGKPVLMRMSSGLNISTDNSKNKIKLRSVLLFVKWIQKNLKPEIPQILYFRYLQSQINYLSLPFLQRVLFFAQFKRVTSCSSAVGLIINRSKFYKLQTWLGTFKGNV